MSCPLLWLHWKVHTHCARKAGHSTWMSKRLLAVNILSQHLGLVTYMYDEQNYYIYICYLQSLERWFDRKIFQVPQWQCLALENKHPEQKNLNSFLFLVYLFPGKQCRISRKIKINPFEPAVCYYSSRKLTIPVFYLLIGHQLIWYLWGLFKCHGHDYFIVDNLYQ